MKNLIMKNLVWLALFAANIGFAMVGKGGLVSHFNAFVAGSVFMLLVENVIKFWLERDHA